MKKIFNRFSILIALLATTLFFACEKDISEEKVGIENISIPQSYSSATSDNNYAVPSTINFGDAKNFKEDEVNNKVNVFLGVSKSGKETTAPFTVDIVSRPDSINLLIANGATFLQLPQAAYSLPSKVALDAGQTTAKFNLEINKTMLKTFSGKKVAVCVALSNPTKYKLNAKSSKVVVIIDVNALNLK